ncbi:MAG: DNA-3-methyladenine glycosylase I, partial [Alphaproteobacteria bacterium]|nr:DNA-3-methyladenine glycosylase I [Alphaproteobacteria bacterium]
MEAFATIRARAAARKGGEAALDALMPAVKSAEALRAIPDDRWLAGMAKRIFQAGFVWKVIEDKWHGFEAAFDGFDPKRVAMMADGDLDALLADDRIVRNGRKIEATRENAVFLVDLAREHGSAARFFADWPDEDYIG